MNADRETAGIFHALSPLINVSGEWLVTVFLQLRRGQQVVAADAGSRLGCFRLVIGPARLHSAFEREFERERVMKHRMSILVVSVLCLATCFAQRPRTNVTGDYLLKTAWGGGSPFNALAPDASGLGCHSDAFAQVLYFHRLAPHGKVSYKCKSGVAISEDFSNYQPQWERFALTKNSTDAGAIQETARFMYYVAVVVRKDFGTEQYVDYPNDAHKKAIESHFDCTLISYAGDVTSGLEAALRNGADMYALLKAEIDGGRPAGFYYKYAKADGHAVVIDGYTVQHGKTYFHVNFGWLGSSDGWYSLAEDLPKSTQNIMVITIVPGTAKPNRTGRGKS